MKVAACLIVRNEASDITSWLAWYHLLGFDTCIVHDDDSTDGTWEAASAAARVQDVRLLRAAGPRGTVHDDRQNACYINTLRDFGDEFDWIGFFDADEYLRLCDAATIKDFLRRFPRGGAVSVHWCNYGSSFHALKPEAPPIEAYTWHGDETRAVNRHVKTLLHTRSWRGTYIGMHCFDVDPALAVDTSGAPIVWSATIGITRTPPDWSVAKIMHYQCRSMEHFVERLKRLPGLPRRTDLWTAYDLHDREDRSPLVHADSVRAQIRRYRQAPAARPVARATPPGDSRVTLVIDLGMGDGADTAFYLAKGFRVLGVEANPRACAALRHRFETELREGRLTLLNAVADGQFGIGREFLVHRTYPDISSVTWRPDVPDAYDVFVVPSIDWRTIVAQQGTPRYLKIDIEGSEPELLHGMLDVPDRPEFLSVACRHGATIETLVALGYTRFILADQNPPGGMALPTEQREGATIAWPSFAGASGPFGLDLFGAESWLDADGARASWREAETQMHRTWFDCHAWRP